MNPTLGYLFHGLHSAWATRPAAIRAHVLSDLRGDPPAHGESFPGQRALALRAAGASTLPYYLPQTLLALGLATALGVAAWLVFALAEPGLWSRGLAAALGFAACIALWRTVTHRFGPPLIDQQRWARAHMALERSGDGQARPLGVALLTVVALVFGLDGFMSGFTLASELFGSTLTPRLAIVATVVFSVVTSFLLFELTRSAALEKARCRRRNMVRALLASPRAQDHERADAIIAAVGDQLDHDYSQAANRTRSRWALALVIASLTLATLIVRIHSETQLGAEVPAQAEESSQQR